MKRIIICILPLIMLLSGCSGMSLYSRYNEPDTVTVIKTVGIDYLEGEVTVTASTGLGLEKTEAKVYTRTAYTLSEAIEGIRDGFLWDNAYFGHTEYLIISENAARSGISDYLDYVARNDQMRLATSLFILRGTTAQEAIISAVSDKSSASEMLEAIKKESQVASRGYVYSCEDALERLANRGHAIVMAIEQSKVTRLASETDAIELKPSGYAVMKNGYLADFIDSDTAHGTDLLASKVKSGTITITTEQGNKVTLAVADVKVKYKPVYEDKEIKEVNIEVDASLKMEQAGNGIRIEEEEDRKPLEELAAEYLNKQITLAIEYSKGMGIDFCNIGKILEIKNPYKFIKTNTDWEEAFPTMAFNTTIDVVLTRTYDTTDSIDLSGEGDVIGRE